MVRILDRARSAGANWAGARWVRAHWAGAKWAGGVLALATTLAACKSGGGY